MSNDLNADQVANDVDIWEDLANTAKWLLPFLFKLFNSAIGALSFLDNAYNKL